MTVTQQPEANKLYFQKSVPDILIVQNNTIESILFELKITDTLILSEKYLYDSNGKIQIRNLWEVLEKYLSENNLIQEFNYLITETHITPIVEEIVNDETIYTGGDLVTETESKNFSIIKCEAEMETEASTWTAQNFLTRAYREKRTAANRNEFLSFLQLPAQGAITPHFKIVSLQNNTVTETTGTLAEIATKAMPTIITFNSSIGAALTAARLPTSTVVIQLNIWLTGTGLTTNVYTYLVDNNRYRNSKNFAFVNCFGVPETFTATGTTHNKKTNEFGMGNIDNHYRKISQDFVSEKSCNSGFLSEMEMEWTDDFIKSYIVALYTQGTGLTEEITLVGADKTDTEANTLQSFTFGYRTAKNNHLEFRNAVNGIFDITFDQTYN